MPIFSLVAHKHHISDQQFITQKSTAILNSFIYIWNTVKLAYASYHSINTLEKKISTRNPSAREQVCLQSVKSTSTGDQCTNRLKTKKHCDTENFILASVCTWPMGIRWSTSDLHSHHCHLSTCPTEAPKSVSHPR